MRKKKQQHHGEEEGGEAWLLPYSDLMTLLLAVFIVLFAVSKLDQAKASEMASTFKESMMNNKEGVLPDEGDSIVGLDPNGNNEETPPVTSTEDPEDEVTATSTPLPESTPVDTTKEEPTKEELEKYLGQYELSNLEELQSQLTKLFEEEELTSGVTTSIDSRGLIISLNNAILFDSGSATLKPENEGTLIKIAERINKLDNYIRIEGHTDNRPINTTVYPSNWELSTARAAGVVRLFIDKCNVAPEKVVAVGYGEYKPIANNETEAGREKNRRIDIIVLSEKYNNLED